MSSNDRIILDTVTSAIASQSRFEIVSLKIMSAIIDVATISKLLSSEAFAAVVIVRPIIRNIGAEMSRTTIPIVYGSSFFVSGSSFSRRPVAR